MVWQVRSRREFGLLEACPENMLQALTNYDQPRDSRSHGIAS